MTPNSLVKSWPAVTFSSMLRFAKILMMLAFTLQGFMPAMAMPMSAQSAVMQERTAEAYTNAHEDHGASHADHHDGKSNTQPAGKWQCPLSPAGCNVGFCMACNALPPYVTAEEGRPAIPGTPAPGLMVPMADAGLQPLVPPPRA